MAFAVLVATVPAARAIDPALIIVIDEGSVSVTSQDASFTEQELSVIRQRVDQYAAESPLHRSGRLRLALRGRSLSELQSELRAADLNDPRAVERATDRLLESYFKDTKLTPPIEWVVGRDFRRMKQTTGSVVAIGSNLVVDGPIADLVTIGSRVEFGPNAEVTNRFASVGSHVELANAASIRGQELQLTLPVDLSDWGRVDAPSAGLGVGTRISMTIVGILTSFALGMLFLRIAPTWSARSLDWMRIEPARSFGFGLLYLLGLLPGALLLVLTVIGIVLLPTYFLAAGVFSWLAYIVTASWVGASVAPRGSPWQTLLLGLVVLFGVGWIPGMGSLVTIAAMIFGAGALMRALYDRMRGRRRGPMKVEPAASAESMPVQPAPERTT